MISFDYHGCTLLQYVVMIKISCKEAKRKGLSKYFTGKPCPKGHICPRRVSNNSCCECDNQLARTRCRTSEYYKTWKTSQRQKAIDHLGGKCVKCGFSDIRALQIDHVNGGGTQERRSLNYNFWKLYKKVCVDTSNQYQLLCANCNWIKRIENGEVDRRVVS